MKQPSSSPSFLDQAAAPVARWFQRVQDGIARTLWFRNSGNLAAVVGVIGLTMMGVAGVLWPIGPAVSGAGLTTAGVGGAGLVENHITKRVSKWDGRG